MIGLPIVLHILSLFGAGVAIVLTQHFYDIHEGASGFKSFCNIGQTFNCDIVSASAYSEFLFGIPLSSFAVGWSLSLFVISLFLHNPYWKRETIRACFGLTLLGTLFSIFYMGIMAFKLHTYCILCFVMDGITISSLGVSFLLKPEGFSKHKLDLGKWKVFAGSAATCLILSILGLQTMDSGSFPASELNEMIESVLNTPPVAVRSDEIFPSIGPKDAPITLVEYSDFQCPFCRMGALKLNSVLNRYPKMIRVVFRNFPLDQACNSAMNQSMHPMACEAAKAAVCAQKFGHFKEMYEELFEQQALLAPGKPAEIAKGLGLDPTQFEACMNSPETTLALTRDVNEAIQLGIKSTPTFFINGHRMEGVYPFAAWTKIIERSYVNR